MNKRYYIMSPDEMQQIVIEGTTLVNAYNKAIESSYEVATFFEEYNMASCYVEELASEEA